MNGALTPIAGRLGKLVRLLASDRDGEVVAAVQAIKRTLANVSLDIHALADGIEECNGKKFTEADAIEIYQRGVEDGHRAAEQNGALNFSTVGEPSWNEIARMRSKCRTAPATRARIRRRYGSLDGARGRAD